MQSTTFARCLSILGGIGLIGVAGYVNVLHTASFDMQIVVGYGAGNKDALVSRLSLIANVQKEMLMGGLPTVTPQNIYETAIEITKASDFSAPQRFFTDPSTVPPPGPPQPSPDVVAAGQIEMEKSKSTERIKLAEIQSQERLKGAELVQEEQLARLEAEVKILIEQMKGGQSADIEQMKLGGSLQIERERRDGSLQLEQVKSAMSPENKKNEKLDGIAKLIAELRAAQKQIGDTLTAPREVIRGKDGRVAGVRVGGVERKVQRDAEGRVTGLQ